MQAPVRNEINWIIQSWEFNSSATAVPAAVALPFALKAAALCFGIVLISGPGRAEESQVNWIYFILSAMAPYGVVFQWLLALVHERTTLTPTSPVGVINSYWWWSCLVGNWLGMTVLCDMHAWAAKVHRPSFFNDYKAASIHYGRSKSCNQSKRGIKPVLRLSVHVNPPESPQFVGDGGEAGGPGAGGGGQWLPQPYPHDIIKFVISQLCDIT